MAEKSRDAFRTISEVADWLDVPTHVLRFWESRFSQIKPVKRAGGRRYYRPSDMRVIRGVKVLLHDQGMTIRGVQKLFREEGIKHVAGYAPMLFDETDEETDAPALNEEALERAARPAAAARSTRDAEPAPEAPAPDEAAKEPDPIEELPMFRRSAPGNGKAPAPAEAAPPPKPKIPATPDVPAIDALDDADDHARPAGVAARLKALPASELAKHKDVLASASERLRALADRHA